jgi:hypothetical protein
MEGVSLNTIQFNMLLIALLVPAIAATPVLESHPIGVQDEIASYPIDTDVSSHPIDVDSTEIAEIDEQSINTYPPCPQDPHTLRKRGWDFDTSSKYRDFLQPHCLGSPIRWFGPGYRTDRLPTITELYAGGYRYSHKLRDGVEIRYGPTANCENDFRGWEHSTLRQPFIKMRNSFNRNDEATVSQRVGMVRTISAKATNVCLIVECAGKCKNKAGPILDTLWEASESNHCDANRGHGWFSRDTDYHEKCECTIYYGWGGFCSFESGKIVKKIPEAHKFDHFW